MNSIILANFPILSQLLYNRSMSVNFTNLFPENLYHSYIVEANPDITVTLLRDFFEARGDIQIGSLDTLCQNYDSFTIDDSSFLRNWHSHKNATMGKRICILGAKSINREAEQSLLKMLEEPAFDTHFFLVVPNALFLLETIRSRAHIVKVVNDDDDVLKQQVLKFIASSPKDRIDFVAEMIKKYKDEDSSGNLRFNATCFINELEKVIYEKFIIKKEDETQFILKELHQSRKFLSTPGASVKMILEHIALVL